ncbi:hypothetical protein I5677_08260 [Mobilitalea sibirica]|uniref:RND related barrel-sandwich hybrid domain-containing protein n=1 Tax=Mobilitalea sibirica TaxID=1462919 RepID=A0A8J7H982_9FIRM|nr:HlyD family efflux transporter periplasmic adaptor subunit [Mobilitalea sibirica]MBH1940880.1 hypothetical protein [Mobilitalea sibirica]
MRNKNRVVKFKKQKNINIGIIIFSIMFIYVAINVYIYFTKEHISIYEVKDGSNSEDNLITGLILREESIIYSEKAGYISYLQKDGARVAKNTSVYAVDDSRQILDIITSAENPISLTKENSAKFQYEIKKFQTSFSDHNFSYVYEFKEDANSTVLELLNTAMIEKGLDIQEETGITYNYEILTSPDSGIISYYMDSFETVTAETVNRDLFVTDNYERVALRSTEIYGQNSPIYKLITSQNWSIILPLTKDQYSKLAGKETLDFTILKDDFKTSAKLHLFQKDSEYYAQLDMDKHMANYIDDRFLDLEIHMDIIDGLKIPLTSIVEKDFYLVPLRYFTMGGDSGKNGLTKLTYTKTGDINITFVPADIYYQDDTYGYVDTRLFEPGDWIQAPDSTDRIQLYQTGKLTGVFNVNMGYAVFKRIEIIYQNKEYCIVKKGTSYGISLYDHIALDGTTAVEQAIIY